MDENKVLNELKNIYQIVHQQLVFIESKNGALVVFCVAIIALVFSNEINIDWIYKIFIVGLFLACLMGLYSFAPYKYKCRRIKKIDHWNDSLIYFRNIAKYNPEEAKIYIAEICQALGVNEEIAENDMAYSYAVENITLSQIIVVKSNIFRYASLIAFASIGILLFKLFFQG